MDAFLTWLGANAIDIMTLAGIVIVGLNLRERITTLNTTVEAQERSLGAQREVITGLQTLVDGLRHAYEMLDAPKWAERYEAYKQTRDREAEAAIAEVRRQAETEKLTKGLAARMTMDQMIQEMAALFVLATQWIAYVPVPTRDQDIGIVARGLSDGTRDRLLNAARTAPAPEPTLGEILAAMPASATARPVRPPSLLNPYASPPPEPPTPA